MMSNEALAGQAASAKACRPGLQVPAQRLQVVRVEGQAGPAVDVDQRVEEQVRVAREDLAVVDHDVELELVAQQGRQVGHGQRGDVPVARVLELGDVERPRLTWSFSNFLTSRTASLSAGSSRPVA